MTTLEHAGADIANAILYDDLPEGRLFRLTSIGHEWGIFWDEEGNEQEPPTVNWTAVLRRLQTNPEEVRQWVQTRGTKCFLFLHYVLDFDYGEEAVEQDESADASSAEASDGEELDGEQRGATEGNDGRETEELRSDESEAHQVLYSIPVELQVIFLAIDLYQDAVKIPESRGFYPLHLVCRCGNDVYVDVEDTAMQFSWRKISNKVFERIFRLYPDAASVRLSDDGRTALNCLCGVSYEDDELPVNAIMSLLSVYPEAASLPDVKGSYPIHTICTRGWRDNYLDPSPVIPALLKAYPQALHFPEQENGLYPLHTACIELLSVTTIKSFSKKFPQATRIRSKIFDEGRTPILENICRCREVEHYEVTRLLLEASPCAASMTDAGPIYTHGDYTVPAGDAFDYICVEYCNAAGVRWTLHEGLNEEGHDDTTSDEDPDEYIVANMRFLKGDLVEDRARDADYLTATFDVLLDILRVMYGRAVFMPLHAFCSGLLCRPWNLVVLKEMLVRFGQDAKEKDIRGNLPLHLFLESCMLGLSRALKRKYATNAEDYHNAVAKCFELLLEANPRASFIVNSEDRLPIHLALDNHCLSSKTIMQSLVTPLALRARDIDTRLYPFARAAVGSAADVELTYLLLRKDPSVLRELVVN